MSGEMGYTPTSKDLVFTETVDGETVEQIYNLGDMAWSKSLLCIRNLAEH